MSNIRHTYTVDGETRSLRAWAIELCVPYGRISRMHALGVPVVMVAVMPPSSHVSTGVPGAPGSWTWHALDYEDDVWAQDFVRKHPLGATLDAVGAALGMTKERARQVEDAIFAKLRRTGAVLALHEPREAA